jgi:hypothetical protein
MKPNLNVQAKAGWCLWYVQEALGVPHLYKSAWEAYQHTTRKRGGTAPNGGIIWFEHWGTYGTPPTYGNWGHVVFKWNNKFYSSPAKGFGFDTYGTVQQIEKVYNSKYIGWSEDISGVNIIERINMPTEKDVREYFLTYEGREPTTKEVRDYTEKSWRYLTDKLLASMKKRLTVKPAPETPAVKPADTTTNPSIEDKPNVAQSDVLETPAKMGWSDIVKQFMASFVRAINDILGKK